MTVHELKCWPEFFRAIMAGAKTFESRKNDRKFKTGDVLHLREWRQDEQKYTGRHGTVKVRYILEGERFGVMAGWVCMGIEV